MAATDNVRRVSSISAWSLGAEPVGAMFRTQTTIKANKPGIIIADEVLAVEDIQHTVVVKFQGLASPPTPGDMSTVTVIGQSFTNSTGGGGSGGGGKTVSCATMMFTGAEIDMNQDPAVQTLEGRYKGTSLQPITVA